MHSLVQIDTMRSAAIAAAISGLVCYPRLAIWTGRPNSLWFMLTMLVLVSFMLWSFVFGWYPRFMSRPVVHFHPGRGVWVLAVAGGLIGGMILRFGVDPILRAARPGDYPASAAEWIVFTLFSLGFSQLFVSYAPLSFFLRLFGRATAAIGLTVLFGLGLLAAQLQGTGVELEPSFLVSLYLIRALFGVMSGILFLHGGLLPTMSWALLLELRLLPGLNLS
jgi:hypothetical protein